MWAIVRRAIVLVLLLSGGVASLIYGAMFHATAVVEKREKDVTIEVPLPLPPPRPFEGGSPFGRPGFREPVPMIKKTVKQSELVAVNELEPSLMREVTVGGVARQPSGEVKRVENESGGEGPALCPT
jgi:hypothetical protein